MSDLSRRQELLEYLETGRLRDAVAGDDLSEAAQDLLIYIVSRYCGPRPKRRKIGMREISK